nr:MAG TPA_asm: hypothetical protein [Caudoviricetes sp.]
MRFTEVLKAIFNTFIRKESKTNQRAMGKSQSKWKHQKDRKL